MPINFLIGNLNTFHAPSNDWRVTHHRQAAQRTAINDAVNRALYRQKVPLPCLVTLTRIGPGRVPDERLQHTLEFVANQIQKRIGTDDGRLVRFVYKQLPPVEAVVGVRVEIQPQSKVESGTNSV